MEPDYACKNFYWHIILNLLYTKKLFVTGISKLNLTELSHNNNIAVETAVKIILILGKNNEPLFY